MIPPTIEQVRLAAAEFHKPQEYADNWFLMMQSQRWCVNHGQPIANWKAYLSYFIRSNFNIHLTKSAPHSATPPQQSATSQVPQAPQADYYASQWRDPMMVLPNQIESDRRREAEYQIYLREKDTDRYKEARRRVLKRFGLDDD